MKLLKFLLVLFLISFSIKAYNFVELNNQKRLELAEYFVDMDSAFLYDSSISLKENTVKEIKAISPYYNGLGGNIPFNEKVANLIFDNHQQKYKNKKNTLLFSFSTAVLAVIILVFHEYILTRSSNRKNLYLKVFGLLTTLAALLIFVSNVELPDYRKNIRKNTVQEYYLDP